MSAHLTRDSGATSADLSERHWVVPPNQELDKGDINLAGTFHFAQRSTCVSIAGLYQIDRWRGDDSRIAKGSQIASVKQQLMMTSLASWTLSRNTCGIANRRSTAVNSIIIGHGRRAVRVHIINLAGSVPAFRRRTHCAFSTFMVRRWGSNVIGVTTQTIAQNLSINLAPRARCSYSSRTTIQHLRP
jgi:hypothetical protein